MKNKLIELINTYKKNIQDNNRRCKLSDVPESTKFTIRLETEALKEVVFELQQIIN